LAALELALTHRRPPRGLVHHSDPSRQLRADRSFWSSFKRELVHRTHFARRAQTRAAIFEWIEIFFNRERLHSALGYHSPVDFETQLQ
jgi:putative transposase